jgi:hypothetical protein
MEANMPRKRKFEDKSDPDRCRAAKDTAHVFNLKEDGEVEGQAHVWDIRDGEALVIAAYNDGKITAYIEKEERA